MMVAGNEIRHVKAFVYVLINYYFCYCFILFCSSCVFCNEIYDVLKQCIVC